MSKTALIGMTKAMAPQLAAMNIRVNCIAPGVIKTNFSKALWEDSEMFGKNTDFFMKRAGTPEEISGAAAFLCSPDASYITGETIVIAGGVNSRL